MSREIVELAISREKSLRKAALRLGFSHSYLVDVRKGHKPASHKLLLKIAQIHPDLALRVLSCFGFELVVKGTNTQFPTRVYVSDTIYL